MRIGLVVDVETTGLDARKHEIIELAMTPFTYGLDGTVFTVGESFQGLRQPSELIPLEITAITGITNEMVAGRAIDLAEVARLAAAASSSSPTTRPSIAVFSSASVMSSRPSPGLARSARSIGPPKASRARSSPTSRKRPASSMSATGRCTTAWRPSSLAAPLPRSGVSGLSRLLDAARLPSWRIWAENSPYELKDMLKARGYQWNGDSGPQPRAWYIDVPDPQREAELHFLKTEIYRREVDLLVRRIDAHDRFSDRV